MNKIEIFPGFFITSDDSFADIGCGGGGNCVAAGQLGAAVYAVDVNEQSMQAVRDKMRGVPAKHFEGVVAVSDQIPLPTGIASVVVCTEVLEHVGDPAYFMRELIRIGRPGARYLISVPDSLAESLMKYVGPPGYFEAPNHVRIFGREQFRGLVSGAGLTITQEKFVGFYWSMWWALRFASGSPFYPGAPGDPPEVLRKWEETWSALQSTPEGAKGAALLDEAMPKSQVLIATKS